jgi:hypothetical protein
MVKGGVGFADQAGLDLLLADLDKRFELVSEGTQVSFLFSGQHRFVPSCATIVSVFAMPSVYSIPAQGWQTTFAAATVQKSHLFVTSALRQLEKGYTFFDFHGIKAQFTVM